MGGTEHGLDPPRPNRPEPPGPGKCTPGLDSSRSAELIQSWSFNRKEKGTMGMGGVLSTPDARSMFFCGTFNLGLRTAFITF